MNIVETLNQNLTKLVEEVPSVLAVVAILVVGWTVAMVLRGVVRRLGSSLKLNSRVNQAGGGGLNVEGGFAQGAYLMVLILTLIAAMNFLNLALVTEPLKALINPIFSYLPSLVGGLVLALIAWLLARVVRTLVQKSAEALPLEKIEATLDRKQLASTLGGVAYGVVLLLFLPAIFGAFQLGGMLAPVQNLVGELLAFVPNLVSAAVIGLVGWFVAKLLKTVSINVLQAVGADRVGEKAGLTGASTPSNFLGTVVQVFVFVPAFISALDALQLKSITTPATNMLNTLMASIPNIVAAAVIIGIAVLLARFVVPLATNLLAAVGLNKLPAALGLNQMSEPSLSDVAGKVLYAVILLFAVMEGAQRLGLGELSAILSVLIAFAGKIALGSVILIAGFLLARLAHGTIEKVGGPRAGFLASLARVAIVGLVLAMGLDAMGVADDIVRLAFGLTLGSVAVAFALAFGLGGREAAGKIASKLAQRFDG